MSGRRGLLLALLLGLVAITGCFGPVVRPTADFTWCPDGSEGKLDYNFFDHSTTVPGHYITALSWDFGDGSPPQEGYGMVSHRFPHEGTYHVTLVVTDDRGVAGTVTKEVLVQSPAVIREWNLTLGWPATVTGEVVNRSDRTLDSVVIKAKFYSADNVRLTEGTAEILELEPGEVALFSIEAPEYTARIFYAKVFVDSFTVDCQEEPYPQRSDETDS